MLELNDIVDVWPHEIWSSVWVGFELDILTTASTS